MQRLENSASHEDPREGSLTTGLAVIFGTIFVGLVASVLVTKLEKDFDVQKANESPSALRWTQADPPDPEESIPKQEDVYGAQLTEVRKLEEGHLQGYGWVNPKLKKVRVPIDVAMKALLADEADAAPAAEKPKDERKP
jgi:hypothetical protein